MNLARALAGCVVAGCTIATLHAGPMLAEEASVFQSDIPPAFAGFVLAPLLGGEPAASDLEEDLRARMLERAGTEGGIRDLATETGEAPTPPEGSLAPSRTGRLRLALAATTVLLMLGLFAVFLKMLALRRPERPLPARGRSRVAAK